MKLKNRKKIMNLPEDKQLLLQDLCGRLPYGVKVLYKGWDRDHGCEFNTVEDLIGIDDKFIHTLWRDERDKHSIVEPLSITDYKPYLRPMSSMTEEELEEYSSLWNLQDEYSTDIDIQYKIDLFEWLNKKMFDYRGLIPKGLAIEVTKDNNPYKN